MNNLKERLKFMSYKSINKTLKYSIRKLAVGATPVVIGAFLLTGDTTALANEVSGNNVSINYVADSELTEYEKSLIKQGIPEELKNGETYYLVYKNESYLQKNKLPNTGSTSLPLKGIGFATALLTVVLVSKKNRNKILGIVLIGALGQSVVLPDSTFALENNLLAGYNHIVSANSKFEDNLISIDGYKYVGYLTSEDVSLNSVNTQEYNIQKSIVKTTNTDNILDEGRVITKPKEKDIEKPKEKDIEKPKEKDIENKPQVKENLTDVVKNSNDNIPLPVVVEEVLSETAKEEEIEVVENESNATPAEKVTPKEIGINHKEPNENNSVLKNEKEKPHASENIVTEKNVTNESNTKDKISVNENTGKEEKIATKNSTAETPKNIQVTANSPKDTTADTSNKTNSSLTTDGVKPTKVKKKVKVVERIIKVTETIPYKVVYEEDENMENGTTKVIKEGMVGEKTTIQKVLLNNGEELKREITSSTVKQKEVDKVIKVGTKGAKKYTSKQEINSGPESAQKTKLIPKKETVYTEIVESKQRKYVKDYPKLEEATKDIKNNIGLLTTQKDKLSTINITNIFDDSLFEGERRFENVMMYYVQANLKRKREFENQEEVIDNIISKEIPVITGVMRIGTRKPGFETLKGDGKLVNISSNLDEKEIKNIKLSNNNSYVLDKEVPGYLGSAINVNYDKDFKNTKLGLKLDVNNIDSNSVPTIYHYDRKTQIFKPLETQVIGNMAYADINESGAYMVVDKHKQDEIRKLVNDFVPNESNINEKISNKSNGIKKSVVFALDSSGSMEDNDKEGLRKKLTKRFISKLNPKNDKISVIDFDDEIHINKPLTNNFSEALADVDSVDDKGGTNVYLALKTGISILNSEKEENRKKYLFLLTDGKDDLGWWLPNPTEEQYNEIIEEAIKNQIVVYTIGFKSTDEDLLKRIADKTGGKAYLKKEATELPEIFNQLNEEIENKDTDLNKDGISAHYTKEILTEKILLSTLKKSPYYKNQIEKAREKIANDFGLAKTDIDAINKKIESIKDNKYIEGLLNADYDNDKLLNGNEARPEKGFDNKAFLYVLSDPENPDTDGDGNPDNIDKYTDFDKNNGTYLKLTSNGVDSDGDGYDDAFEVNSGKIDSFGERHLPDRWNLGHRDLLLFADIVYYDFRNNYYGKSLKEIYDLAKESMKKDKKIFGSEVLYYLDLISKNKNNYDNEFFNKWKYIYRSTEPYDISLNPIAPLVNSITKVYSDVMVFQNNDDFVITYRGTDEGLPEFITDGKILFNTDKVGYKAKEQFEKLKNALSFDTLKNKRIYITGHSLGGYEAYYAFMKAKEKYNDSIKGVINFNGPGIYNPMIDSLDYRRLLEEYRKNNNSVISISTDKGLINDAIVNAGGEFMHPNPKHYPVKYLDFDKMDVSDYKRYAKLSERFTPIYPHELTSFYGSLEQGHRSTNDKFLSENETLYDSFLKRSLKTMSNVVISVKNTYDNIVDSVKYMERKANNMYESIRDFLYKI